MNVSGLLYWLKEMFREEVGRPVEVELLRSCAVATANAGFSSALPKANDLGIEPCIGLTPFLLVKRFLCVIMSDIT
jgi:hypothetical protein